MHCKHYAEPITAECGMQCWIQIGAYMSTWNASEIEARSKWLCSVAHRRRTANLQSCLLVFCCKHPFRQSIQHQIRADQPFYSKNVSYQEGGPVPFQHCPRNRTPWHQHILNEVGQGICVQVNSEVKTASTSNVYYAIISRNVGWEKC